MTLAEFKAWFEGFTEDMDGPPSAKAWKRIKERVKEIDGTILTRELIYRDRYWPTIINGPVWGGTWSGTSTALLSTNAGASGATDDIHSGQFANLGKAEYSTLAS